MSTRTHRIIGRLDIKGPHVVKGVQLEGLRVVGTPAELASRYYRDGIDELVFIDTVASLYGRNSTLDVVERTADGVFIPLTVGGGIRTLDDVHDVLRVGAHKVSVNSEGVRNPAFLTQIATTLGSQCLVAAIDAKQTGPAAWTVHIDNGREPTGLDAVEWAVECWRAGAGEIMLTSIDHDGMRRGFDVNLARRVSALVPVPVIASGGAATAEHIFEALEAGVADAVALGTILHFGLSTVHLLKRKLREKGMAIRPS